MMRLSAWSFCSVCATLFVSAFGVSGCANEDGGPNDINVWMVEQRALLRPRVVKVDEPKPFLPEPYGAGGLTDPFSPAKLSSGMASSAQPEASSALLDAELKRRKDPLEAFPLDTAKMVGVLKRGSATVALVKIDALLHQVGLGAYLGQNYGKVISITDNATMLREIVQDGAGEWIERNTTLELQEGTQ